MRPTAVLDRIAMDVATELWTRLQDRKILAINIDGVRACLASAPVDTFDLREQNYLEEKILRIIIMKVG